MVKKLEKLFTSHNNVLVYFFKEPTLDCDE